jgi:dihydrofolate reductase
MIKLIAAVDIKFGISKGGEIPWSFPQDLRFFYQKTKNSVVVMGKNTFFSLRNRPLKDRINCVISTTLEPIDGVKIFRSFEDFSAKYEDDFWIIGGATLYNHTLKANLVDQVLITQMHADHHADKFIDASYLEKFSKNTFFNGDGYSIIEYTNPIR